MAILWPQGEDWPLELREHATGLTKHLRDTLDCIDRSQGQAMPSGIVGNIITGTLTMISKTLRTPDLTTVQDTLNIMQTEVKARAGETTKAVETVRMKLRNNAAYIKRSIMVGEQTGSSKGDDGENPKDCRNGQRAARQSTVRQDKREDELCNGRSKWNASFGNAQ